MPGDEAQVDFGIGAPVVRPDGKDNNDIARKKSKAD